MSRPHAFRAGFLFCGLGLGARGFLESMAQLEEHTARFVSVGGVDNDSEACIDFERLTGSPATLADVGAMSPVALRAAWGNDAPDCVFLSPPCKGFSRLLSAKASASPKYQELNRLALKGLWLLLEAWPDDPPPILAFENVPAIKSRGADLLIKMRDLLTRYGYRLHEGLHDCGEIGGLGQHRIRYLLVARRERVVKAFIHRPPKLRVRGCGEILTDLPLPIGQAGAAAGPMHALPNISWLTWVRLSLIPPGGDWRDLPGVVQAGHQRRSVFARYDVRGFEQPARTIAGEGSNGGFGVADPRLFADRDPTRGGGYGVHDWEDPARTVTGMVRVTGSNTPGSIADPRLFGAGFKPATHRNKFKVTDWDEPSGTVIGASRPGSGAATVADPRVEDLGAYRGSLGVVDWTDPAPCVRSASNPRTSPSSIADERLAEAVRLKQTAAGADTFKGRPGLMRVADWERPSHAVTGSATPTGGNGVGAVADPRDVAVAVELNCAPRRGAYGVLSWEEAAATVTGSANVDNGRFAVADPREAPPVIRSPWDCWHRPLTTLELGALQGLPATLNGEPTVLAGRSAGRWRERIGNAVPKNAGKAIGNSILQALLAAALGTWTLSSDGIWVRKDGRSEYEWGAEIDAGL